MDIHLIWAQDKNGSIGINGDLPWHIPQDLKNFKKITLNQVIVMGRKTWDSLKLKPLPKRRNIVLTSQHKIQDVDVFNNVNELLKSLIDSKEKQIFIIGGAHGLDSDLLQQARIKMSLSPMTLPHGLARLFITEQLYRAGTILRGEPYHKGP